MKYSCNIKDVSQSWGGILAITLLLILVVFAIFTSSDQGKRLSGTGGNVEWEDVQEQRKENPRNITVKNGQKLVVF